MRTLGVTRPGRAIRPAYEGIETRCLCGTHRSSRQVARSAPPMRGLKRDDLRAVVIDQHDMSRDPPRL